MAHAVGGVYPPRAGNYAAKILHRSGITSAITIIINQIYRATKAKNLLTRETKREKRDEGGGGREARAHTHIDTYTRASEREKKREGVRKGEAKGRRNVGE